MKSKLAIFSRGILKVALIAILTATAFHRVLALEAVDTGDTYTLTSASTSNYGTSGTMVVSGSGTTSLGRSWIQFNLNSVLPAGTTWNQVDKATLKLWVTTTTTSGTINVFAVSGTSWAERTIDNANAPGLYSSPEGSFAVSSSGNFVTFDLTVLVQDWIEGTPNGMPNYGIALVSASNTVNVSFDTKESTTTSHGPQLDIVLTTSTAATISGTLPATQVSGLSAVATSGNYSSLSGTPTIPTNDNQLTNGSWVTFRSRI